MSTGASGHLVWRSRVLRWRQLYPDPRWIRGKYDPQLVKATPLRCRKCGATDNVTRHHKGHEYIFAVFMPEWYAARYVRFVNSDWVPLCTERCHARIHDLYAPIVAEVRDYVQDCIREVRYDPEDKLGIYPHFIWRTRPDRRVLESFRKRMIAKCDWWLARKNKKARRGRYKDHR